MSRSPVTVPVLTSPRLQSYWAVARKAPRRFPRIRRRCGQSLGRRHDPRRRAPPPGGVRHRPGRRARQSVPGDRPGFRSRHWLPDAQRDRFQDTRRGSGWSQLDLSLKRPTRIRRAAAADPDNDSISSRSSDERTGWRAASARFGPSSPSERTGSRSSGTTIGLPASRADDGAGRQSRHASWVAPTQHIASVARTTAAQAPRRWTVLQASVLIPSLTVAVSRQVSILQASSLAIRACRRSKVTREVSSMGLSCVCGILTPLRYAGGTHCQGFADP